MMHYYYIERVSIIICYVKECFERNSEVCDSLLSHHKITRKMIFFLNLVTFTRSRWPRFIKLKKSNHLTCGSVDSNRKLNGNTLVN